MGGSLTSPMNDDDDDEGGGHGGGKEERCARQTNAFAQERDR